MASRTAITSTVLLLAISPAVAHAAIVVERPELRASAGGQPTTAAYMVVRNTGPTADALVGASCTCADSVMAHQTLTMKGIAHMTMEMTTPIPPHAVVVFAPGGRHLMLTGLKAPIAAGSRTPIVLNFQKAGRRTVAFQAVASPGAAP